MSDDATRPRPGEVPATRRAYSLEFFPPRTPEGVEKLRAARRQLAQLEPAFCSVTFGAGGSTREGTLETVLEIRAEGVPAAPHISCIGSTRANLADVLAQYRTHGIRHLVALRGDMPSGTFDAGVVRGQSEGAGAPGDAAPRCRPHSACSCAEPLRMTDACCRVSVFLLLSRKLLLSMMRRSGTVNRPADALPACEPVRLRTVIQAAFGQRRKTLVNALSAGLALPREEASALVAGLGLPPDVRAERLEPRQFVELAEGLRQHGVTWA